MNGNGIRPAERLGLASIGFRLEGMDAKGYADIVPSFLKAIPKDPGTQQPLSFQ